MIILTSYVDKGYKKELERTNVFKDIIKVMKSIDRKHNIKFYIVSNLKNIEELNDINYTLIDYPRYVWSYVDKIFYSFKMNLEENEEVLWIDFNKFKEYHPLILNVVNNVYKKDSFLYTVTWNERAIEMYCVDKEWRPFHSYLEREGIWYKDIIPLLEQFFFIPNGMSTHEILRDIELIKTIVDYGSWMVGYPYKTPNGYPSLGNGEGVVLGYLITKYNLPSGRFSDPSQTSISPL